MRSPPDDNGASLSRREEEQARLRAVFDSLDQDGNGKLDVAEMQAALRELGLPSGRGYMRELLTQYDKDADRQIDFEEFTSYVESKETVMRLAFSRVDGDGDEHLDVGEVQQAVQALGLQVTPSEADAMVRLLDRDGDGRIDYDEFQRFVVMLPSAQMRSSQILSAWIDSADWVEETHYRLTHVPPTQSLERFIAGGVAGAVSRTVVAPLERLRTIMMADRSATRLLPTLQRMWTEDGLRGLWRGNLATVIKVFPSNAIQFAVYEGAKDVMQAAAHDQSADLSGPQKMFAGLLAGAAAATVTYPLEALRTQICVVHSAAGARPAYTALVRSALAQRGVAGLFQGYTAGVANYSASGALGFGTYEMLCTLYTRHWSGGEPPSTGTKGTLGGAAAFLTMAACMPLENVTRRLQAQGQPGFPRLYSGPLDCTLKMLRSEGVRAFWRGSLSSFLKVVPSIAATRVLYEGLVAYRGIGGVRRYRAEDKG